MYINEIENNGVKIPNNNNAVVFSQIAIGGTVDQTTTTPTYSIAQCECPSCSASTTTQASVITAIVTALLATVVFLVVQIAVCKLHPKYRSGEVGVLAGGGGAGI